MAVDMEPFLLLIAIHKLVLQLHVLVVTLHMVVIPQLYQFKVEVVLVVMVLLVFLDHLIIKLKVVEVLEHKT